MLAVFFGSCTQQKKIIYLQKKLESDTLSVYTNNHPEYFLKAGDILYISIASINQEVVNAFNINQSTVYTAYYTDASLYVNGYSVSDSGLIDIPIFGRIEVMGLSVAKAREKIQERVNQYLKDATVKVKLLSFKVTMLGEVGRPGIYNNYNDNITVLEAVGMAGDITDYGNKTKVLVVRPTENGNETFRLDLTDINILASDAYYLMPNDIVYVEPVRTKIFRLNAPNISIILSMITTTIIIINFNRSIF